MTFMKIIRRNFNLTQRKIILIFTYLIFFIAFLRFYSISTFKNEKTKETLKLSDTNALLKVFNLKLKTNDDKNNSGIMNCHSRIEKSTIQVESKPHAPCNNEDWILINEEGVVTFNYKYLDRNNIKIEKCSYQAVEWYKDDFNYQLLPERSINNGSILDKSKDFFHFKCWQSGGGSHKYHSAHARIFKSKAKHDNERRDLPEKPLNIMMFGLDSVSRETWLNTLSKSSDYLLNKMGSNVLNGYNIVGDGTPAALIPLLTSFHEEELPNTIKKTSNAKHVDIVYPFIWKNFTQKLGYASLYGEDWPGIGTFQYRMIGMSEPPTTHYLRPFQLSNMNEKVAKKQDANSACMNGRTNLALHFDYMNDFMNVYKDDGFFGLIFLGEYSHDSNDRLSWVDNELLKFITRFDENKNVSDNTILILFADHGPRFSNLRKSVRGLLHERNPFFSVYLPPNFKKRYPIEFEQLKRNTDKLVTPMDVHRTMMDILK
jgi:hypothetical protein